MQTIKSLSSALGWFSRMVSLTVEFDHPMGVDTGEEFIIPWDSFTGVVPLIDLTSYLRGRVCLTVPDGVRIKYTSIVLAIEQYLHYLDPFVSSELCTRELTITPTSSSSNWLEGITVIHFEIPLYPFVNLKDCRVTMITQSSTGITSTISVRLTVRDMVTSSRSSSSGGLFLEEQQCDRITTLDESTSSGSLSGKGNDGKPRCRWWSSYVGENFGLRHTLSVTVQRPWYAHSPEHFVPISLYRLITPMVPGCDGTAAPCIYDFQEEYSSDLEHNNEINEEEEDELGVNWRPVVLSLSNFHGVCQMTFPSRWVSLDTPLLGKITFHDFTEAVVSCHLLLIRAEHVQGEVKEKTLLIHQVFGRPFLHLYDMIEKGAMLTTGGSSRLDPEEQDDYNDEDDDEEDNEKPNNQDEKDDERDGIEQVGMEVKKENTDGVHTTPSQDRNKEEGNAERVYQGLLPQHFNLSQKAIDTKKYQKNKKFTKRDYGYGTTVDGNNDNDDDNDDFLNRPVLPRDGHCATFIVEMPLACRISANDNTGIRGSSSGSGGSSSSSGGGGSSSSSGSNSSSTSHHNNTHHNDHINDINDINIHLHEPSTPHIQQNHHHQHIHAEKEASLLLRRKLCLSPSFTTNQKDGDPFYLHVDFDEDDDEEDEEDEEEEIEEKEVSVSNTVDLESGSNIATTEIDDDNHLISGSSVNSSGGDGVSRISDSTARGGVNGEDDDEVIFQQLRTIHRKNQQQLKKQRKLALKQQQRVIKAYDYLEEAIAVRYYLRMVIRGVDADDTVPYDCDIRWTTTEIVLYRSQHPCHHSPSTTTTAATTMPSSSSQA